MKSISKLITQLASGSVSLAELNVQCELKLGKKSNSPKFLKQFYLTPNPMLGVNKRTDRTRRK